jgi:hypothetical protein
MNNESEVFYTEALHILQEADVPFMLGGAFALFHYTGLHRDTKDLDVFLKAADYPAVLKLFADKGYEVVQHDVRWLAKIYKGDYFIDLIYNSVNNICMVDDSWFHYSQEATLFGLKLKLLSAEELIWCKSFVWNRERFDGADINHIILKYGKQLDWKHLLARLDPHWHLLLAHLLMFQFVYPSDYRDIIPAWLFDELISRAQDQYTMPPPLINVCRGPMIDNTQYAIDIKEWDYKSYTIMTT